MDLFECINNNFPISKEIVIADETSSWLKIIKPFNMVVNKAISHKGYTVQEWMKDRYSDIFSTKRFEIAQQKIEHLKLTIPLNIKSGEEDEDINWDELNYWMFWERNGVVHRLDKDTGGIMILAKTPDEYIKLLSLFRERKVTKTYRALVHGLIKDDCGVIDKPLGRLPWNRSRFGVLAGGRESVTEFKVLERWSDLQVVKNSEKENFSLVELYPKTGRTHQIRVHLLSIGHPIVGDVIYGGRKQLRKDQQWCERLCLAAVGLEF